NKAEVESLIRGVKGFVLKAARPRARLKASMHRIADDFGGTQSALQGDRCKACGLGLIEQDDILGRPLMNTPASTTAGASIKFGPAIPGPVGDTDSGRGSAAGRWASDHEQRHLISLPHLFANAKPQHFDLSQEGPATSETWRGLGRPSNDTPQTALTNASKA